MWPITEKRAKPLLPLAGIPLISHLTEKIPNNIPIVVSTNAAFGNDFIEWKNTQDRSNISIVVEETINDDQKLGALGAVAQWIENENIYEDVLLLTGDNYCGFSIEKFISSARPSISLLAAHDIGNLGLAKLFGTVLLNEDGKQIKGFEEKPKNPKTTLVSTGCSILSAEILPILKEYAKQHPDNIGGIFEELIQRNINIDCFQFEDPWFDIGSFNAYIEATKILVGNHTLKDSEEQIQNCTLNGANVIGAGSRVINSTLNNVVLFNNCIVDDCILENCIIDNECALKGIDLTGKMLRERTTLKM
ncbi:MAG: hypothetical protein KAS32_16905 [Candidatus Peribacteraceae bacterium]|nr:hypothetical protein [Candidatus Peribacteraceae bacterium]